MKKHLLGAFFVMIATAAVSQVANDADGNFDSTSYVETDSTTTSTSTVTSTNNNTNDTSINSVNSNTNDTTVNSTSSSTNTNNNTSTVTSTSTNNNVNNNTSSSTINATNNNNSVIDSTTNSSVTNNSTIDQTTTSTVDQNVNQNTTSNIDQTINQSSNSTVTSTNNNTNVNQSTSSINSSSENINTNNSSVDQTITSPPPSAIAPTIMGSGNDSCTVTFSSAVQTQILGISGGGHIRDMNCERLKNSKTLYNMGMKVAAVSLMCQDPGVFEAMLMAGTPCPFMGDIGESAAERWENNPDQLPDGVDPLKLSGDKIEINSTSNRRLPLRMR